jgi:hypothetical protein
MVHKIAFLFLTLDNPNFPDIWNNYFKGNENKINIYIHPKYPDLVTWNNKKIIKNLKETSWGFIVSAYIELFKEAIKNKDNIKFITISESCVPIKPFNKLYNDLTKKYINESLIKLLPIHNYDWNERLSLEIQQKLKNKLIKHYARMCLSRHHVKQLLHNNIYLNLFTKMHVGDEFFLSSIMPIRNFKNIAITFDDWDYIEKQKKDIKKQIKKLYEKQEENDRIDNTDKIKILKETFNDIAKNPKKIFKVSKEDLQNIKNTESYFYRKFDKTSDIEKYIYNFI